MTISVDLTLNDRQFQQAIKTAETATKSFSDAAEKSAKAAENAFSGLKNVIAGIGFGKMISDSINLGASLAKLSAATGISIQNIKGFQDALKNAGAESEGASAAFSDLMKNIGDAGTQGGDLLVAFNKLGISLGDLGSMSDKDIMRKTVEGLAKMPAGADRTSTALKLMGEAAKTVDWDKAAASIDSYTQKAAGMASSAKAAADAQKNLSSAYGSVQEGILAALEPLSKLAAELLKNTDAIRSFVSAAIKVAEVFAAFYAATKAVEVITGLAQAMNLARVGSLAMGTSMLGSTKVIMDFKDGISLLGAAFTRTSVMAGGAAVSVRGFGSALAIAGSGFLKMLPLIGNVAMALTALNEVTRMVSGNSIVEWAEEGAKALGLISQTSKEAAVEAAKLSEAQEQQKAKPEFLRKTQEELKALVDTYKLANAEQIKQIGLETSLIGLGEAQATKKRAIAELDKKNIEEVRALTEKYNATTDTTLKNEYAGAIDKVNAAYKEQKVQLEAALAAQEKKIQANNLEKFSMDQLFQNSQKLKDIQDQIAAVNMSALDKQYQSIEASARKAAEAKIQEENVRRGKGNEMSAEEEKKYYDAAIQGAGQLKKATEELAAAETARIKTLEYAKERLQIERDLRGVQDDMAKMTMTEIEKKEYDIKRAAEERARAFIEAENARTGTKMSSSEEQAIIDQYIAGTDQLIESTKKSYDMSRSWATGWKQAMNEYITAAGDGASKAKSIFGKAMSGMEDLLVNFAKTGKFEWKNFVAMMLEELLRAQIQVIFAQMLGDMTGAMKGSAGGGMLGSMGGLFGGGGGGAMGGAAGGAGGLLGGLGKMLGLGGGKDSTISGGGIGGGSSGGLLGGLGKMLGFGGSSKDQSAGGDISQEAYDALMGMNTSGSAGGDISQEAYDALMGNSAPAANDFFSGMSNQSSDVWTGIGDQGTAFWDQMSNDSSNFWDQASSLGGGSDSSWMGGGSSGGDSGGGWGDAISSIGDAFSGWFADGGSIPAGKWGIAGEAGAEVISGPATVTPVGDLAAPAGGGSTNVTYNINAVDAQSFKQLLAQDPSYLYGLTMMGANGITGRR